VWCCLFLWLLPQSDLVAKPRKRNKPSRQQSEDQVFEPEADADDEPAKSRRRKRRDKEEGKGPGADAVSGAGPDRRAPKPKEKADEDGEAVDVEESGPVVGGVDTSKLPVPEYEYTGKPPPEYDKYEVIDKTIGFRDDGFYSIEAYEDGAIWVGTYEGRAYRSEDGGDNWRETTVLPDVKSLFGFPYQKVLLGALRDSSPTFPSSTNLTYGLGGLSALGVSNSMLKGDINGARGTMASPSGFSLNTTPSLTASGEFNNPLGADTRAAIGAGSVVLGAGLSARAPRLALLLTILRRPIANISLQRLLFLTAVRNPLVARIVRHPTRKRLLFATTAFGLYKSVDKGYSWYRAFPGLTLAERSTYDVVVDPENPDRVYLGTGRGLYQSDDAGMSWTKNTKVPEIIVKKIAIDPTDSNYVYVGGYGGVYRSSDRAENFEFVYYHSLIRRRDVFWIKIDPFDPNTAYLGTGDGLMRTRNLRTATSQDWQVVNPLRTVNLVISTVDACNKHPGHIYIMTRADLPTINYGANGPESLMLESWDYGKSFRVLTGLRNAGDIRWFTLDPNDSDTVWVALSRSIVRVQRKKDGESREISRKSLAKERLALTPVLPKDPSLSQVMLAALAYTEVGVDTMTKGLDRLRSRRWLPDRINVGVKRREFNIGGRMQDIQFPGDKQIYINSDVEWVAMVWATWALPDLAYRTDSTAMNRYRVLMMNDQVRYRIMYNIHRNYGELQRLKVRQAHGRSRDLYTRVMDRVRIEYLETVVDQISGGFLTRWKQKAKQ
jgi:hypothetical protein